MRSSPAVASWIHRTHRLAAAEAVVATATTEEVVDISIWDSSFNYLHVDARLIDIVDDEWRKDTLGDDEIVSVKVADIVDDRDDLVNAKPKAIDPVERWLDLDLGSLGVPTPNNPQQPSR